MSEPRRRTLYGGAWVSEQSYVPPSVHPALGPAESVEVIEAAPVEAELERLRRIEQAARDALMGLEVAADMGCACTGYYTCNSCPAEIAEQAALTAEALREALSDKAAA